MEQKIIEVTDLKSNSDFHPYKANGFENLRVRYRIEYIDNKHDWDMSEKAIQRCSDSEPWELYTVKIYDDPGTALYFYTSYLIRSYPPYDEMNRIYDVKMWMEIYNGDEMIYEQYIEPESTYRYSMTQLLNVEMRKQIKAQRRQISKSSNVIRRYEEFIEMVPELWKQFIEMEGK
jgi:hypothetical protein